MTTKSKRERMARLDFLRGYIRALQHQGRSVQQTIEGAVAEEKALLETFLPAEREE